MPLDGHSYLVAQGWSGSGTGLRTDAISRPLAIPQKKTLAGLGKDRDEAFPFWDHLFSAAAKAIQIKVSNEDGDSDNTESNSAPTFKRTSTGILSNRRPLNEALAISGVSTPDSESMVSIGAPQLSLLATAKREAAKRGLYSRFFRGPVLGPDDRLQGDDESQISGDVVSTMATVEESIEIEFATKKSKKKRKPEGSALDGDEDWRLERKRRKKEKIEKKEKGKEERAGRKLKKVNDGEEARAEAGIEKDGLDKKERKRRKRERREAEKMAREIVDVTPQRLGRIAKERRNRARGRKARE